MRPLLRLTSLSLLALFSIILAMPTMASETHPNLTKDLLDARRLVHITPLQSKNKAKAYLHYHGNNRSEEDYSASAIKRKMTPITKATNEVHAHQTIGIADYLLGNYRSSLSNIDQSISISASNHLKAKELESKILKIKLLWGMTNDIRKVDTSLAEIDQTLKSSKFEPETKAWLSYKLSLVHATIDSDLDKSESAEKYFLSAKKYAEKLSTYQEGLEASLQLGQYYLKVHNLNSALKELIESYWLAIGQDNARYIARANHLLADLYFERQIYSKAQEHLSQAASYYGNYEQSPLFASVLRKLADVYFIQGRYNLALVHYFNVLDQELAEKDVDKIIDLRLKLTETYLNLYNFTLAERYLNRATELLNYTDNKTQNVTATLLTAQLYFLKKQPQKAEDLAQEVLQQSQDMHDQVIQLKTLSLLYRITKSVHKDKESLTYLEKYNRLTAINLNHKNELLSHTFLDQVKSIEQSIHYKDQVEELTDLSVEFDKTKKFTLLLGFACTVLFFLLVLNIRRAGRKQKLITELNQELYTHPHSGLKNIRMLNRKLPDSLHRSTYNYEQWRFGQLIDEPLNDRLKFALVDVPMLADIYTEHGYKAGRTEERSFGDHIRSHLIEGARLYHLSDCSFLYIEPNPGKLHQPELLYKQFEEIISSFETQYQVKQNFAVSIADYPFLPRAYTVINDEDLIDLLLLASDICNSIVQLENHSQWVAFTAIPLAPAACFSQNDIRRSSLNAIRKGLIKVHTSGTEDSLTTVLDKLPRHDEDSPLISS
ncbi:tetratricopeptide repeat protein [Vibrio rarus]|uniref:tetratricopeptide repeat protein n=1 Tax=Vibrio rarus TaxID=413403 RepID=UPI0021C257C2|nr:tetratricopeptide repeat protein [Vibrio rarus]